MRVRRVPFLVLAGLAALAAACGSSPTSPSATVTAVTVSGTAPTVGSTAHFTASAALSDGSSRPVTGTATWHSSDTSVATATNGDVTGVAPGVVDISATYRNFTGTTRITVSPALCTFFVFPTGVSIPPAGGTATLNVSVAQQSPDCSWTATSSEAFVTITSGASGNGNGSTSIAVSANTGGARSAVVTIAGRQVTVSQGAGNCVTSVSPATVSHSAELKQQTVTVTAAPGCQWSASTSSPFISLPLVTSGTGTGSFIARVFGNLTGAPRTGSIMVGEQSVTITQQAALGGNFLSFVSDPGDWIGQGWTLLHQAPTSTFTPTVNAQRSELTMQVIGSDGLRTLNWNLRLAAPQGQQLVPGTYLHATRWPFQAPTVPGLDFSGDGRGCNTLSGEFTIAEAVYGSDGLVHRLDVTFTQHCGGAGAALRGRVFYVR